MAVHSFSSIDWKALLYLHGVQVIVSAVAFSILVEIPSGPFAFVMSRFDNRLNTSSSVQHKFSGKSFFGCLKVSGSRGGSEWLKFAYNCLLRTWALSSSCSILRPFTTRHGIEPSDFLRYFSCPKFFDWGLRVLVYSVWERSQPYFWSVCRLQNQRVCCIFWQVCSNSFSFYYLFR